MAPEAFSASGAAGGGASGAEAREPFPERRPRRCELFPERRPRQSSDFKKLVLSPKRVKSIALFP